MPLTETLSEGTDKLGNLSNRMSDTFGRSKEKLGAMGTNLVQKSKDLARVTDDCVHQNVWTAVMTSAAIGFVIGMLIRRR